MLLENRYQLDPKTDLIGQGGFAKVYKARDMKFDMPVAIKHFIGSKGNTGSVTREIKKCIHFNHPNIIRYFDCFESSHTNALGENITEEYGVMEYANAGSLSDIMSGKRKVSIEQFKELILGILDGLAYLHSRSPVIIHRDLKPSNILLHEENGQLIPKICDFGISKELQGTISQTATASLGTMDYMSPEQIEGKAASPATDLWALGCIIYEYFNGQPPFGKASQGASAQQVYWKVMNGKLDEGGMKKVPEPFRGLVKGCVNSEKEQRISSAYMASEVLRGRMIKEEVATIENNTVQEAADKFFITLLGILILVSILIGLSVAFKNGVFTAHIKTDVPLLYDEIEPMEVLDTVKANDSYSEKSKNSASPQQQIAAENRASSDNQKQNTFQSLMPLASLPAPIQKLIKDMVYIQGGTFIMGCTPEQGSDCLEGEKPTHSVTLSSFYLGKYEITQAQWHAIMGDNPSFYAGCEDCPIESVNRYDVYDFVYKLNKITGQKFRLPTESEWEFAARGGKFSRGYKFAGGNNLTSVAWCKDNSGSKTHPVGQKLPNELGLYDMSGNVYEFCSDIYGAYTGTSKINPTGSTSYATLSTFDRLVSRGGGWNNTASNSNLSNRGSTSRETSHKFLGFRLAHD